MKINFTAEHETKLKELALKFLFMGISFQGIIGTTLTVSQLIHDVTIGTLQTLLSNLKRAIDKIKTLDSWSMTKHQEKKLDLLEEQYDFVNLLIGYKRYHAQLQEEKNKVRELRKEYAELEKSTMSPSERLESLRKTIESLGSSVNEDDEGPDEEQGQTMIST